jgi:hypothetical protein
MRWKSYGCAVGAILTLRFLDLYVTYRYTPDLRVEWNPLVSFFGVSWSGFILMQVLVTAFVSAMMFFYFSREPTVITQHNLSFNDFVYVYFFGKFRPWPRRIFSWPKNLKRHLVFMGFLFMLITLFISSFAIVHNLMLIVRIDSYVKFVAKYYGVYFPACFLIITVLSVTLFFAIEYLNYHRTQKVGGLIKVPEQI